MSFIVDFVLSHPILTLFVAGVLFCVYRFYYAPLAACRFYEAQGVPIDAFKTMIGFFYRGYIDQRDRGDMLYSFKTVFQRYDPHKTRAICSNLVNKAQVWLLDEALTKEFLSNVDDFQKSKLGVDHLQRILGKGLVFSEQSDWKTKRVMLSPLFSFDHIRRNVAALNAICDHELERAHTDARAKDGVMDVQQVMEDITGETTLVVFLGDRGRDYRLWDMTLTRCVSWVVQEMNLLMQNPLFIIFGSRFLDLNYNEQIRRINRRVKELRDAIRQIIKEEISATATAEAQQDEKAHRTIISLMVRNKHLETEDDIETAINIILNFQIAGKDTTSRFLMMAVYYLSKHPDIRQKVIKEVEHLFNERQINSVDGLHYLSAFCSEVLRHHGPGDFVFFRESQKDVNIGDLRIKKGTMVTCGFLMNFYNPEYFKDPFTFSPERWQGPEAERLKEHTHIYLPFSAGPRNCMGQHLALLVSKITLIKFLAKFRDFDIAPNHKVVLTLRVSYETLEPLLIKVGETPVPKN